MAFMELVLLPCSIIMSLIRYEFRAIKHSSTKFIEKRLMSLMLNINSMKNWLKKYLFGYFNNIILFISTKIATIDI